MKFDLIVVSSGFSNVPDGAFILPPDGDGTYDVGDHVSYSVSVEAPEGFEVAQTIYGAEYPTINALRIRRGKE